MKKFFKKFFEDAGAYFFLFGFIFHPKKAVGQVYFVDAITEAFARHVCKWDILPLEDELRETHLLRGKSFEEIENIKQNFKSYLERTKGKEEIQKYEEERARMRRTWEEQDAKRQKELAESYNWLKEPVKPGSAIDEMNRQLSGGLV
jgi:hypothetical protein